MKSLVKLELLDEKERFLQTEYTDDGKSGFKLTLIDGLDVWKGHVTEDDLDNLRLNIKMDLNTFTKQTLQALTKTGGKDIVFNYQIKQKKDDSLELIWKKFVPAEDITFQLGKAILKYSTSPSDVICSVLNHCIDCVQSQKSEIISLQTDNDRLSQERVNALKRLEKCVVAKEELEKDLYSKFAAVLNSKKDKIRQLKQSEGKAVQVNNSEPGPSKAMTHSHKRPAKVKSDEDNTTDDEAITQRNKKTKTNDRSYDDDSLILDDEVEEEKTTVVARPKRNRGANKKTTPAKPVLPKVSSKDSNTSISEKPSTSRSSDRRSTSRKSRASSGNTSYDNDADAMLDEI